MFSSESTSGIPAEIIFAVPNDLFLLLKKSDYITSNSIEIIPVPRNQNYTENPGATQVTSSYIADFINARSTYVEEDTETTNCTETTSVTTTTTKAA